jgi:hypothetical protein
MTQPVTAAGQTIAKMLDASGNGNTVTFTGATLQVDSGGRPYISFDGSTTFGLTGSINFTSTDKLTIISGVNADISLAAIGMVVNHNATGATSFSVEASNGVAGAIAVVANGATGSGTASKTGLGTSLQAALTMTADIAANNVTLRRNGVVDQSVTGTLTGTGFANAVLGIGRQSNSALRFYKGGLYGLVLCGAAVNQSKLLQAERQIAARTGIAI